MSVFGFRFPKKHRVYLTHDVQFLFDQGHAFLVFPFKVVIANAKTKDVPLKVLITVPKNKHKLAVTRNTIKRRTREAFRLNHQILSDKLSTAGKSILAGFIYIHDKELDYNVIEQAMFKIFKKIEALISDEN